MILSDTHTVTRGQMAAYAAPALAMAVIGIPIYVYVPKFYSDVVGLDVALVGAILFGVRIFDAVTDPLLGVLSDGVQSTYGRRRPFVLIGSLLLSIALFLLLNPPELSARGDLLWFATTLTAVFLFWTVVVVPYESLGPEIVSDYQERTTLFAWRDGALILGTLVAAVSPFVIRSLSTVPAGPEQEKAVFFHMSVLYAPAIVLAALWCVRAIGERSPGAGQSRSRARFTFDLDGLRKNRPFCILLAAYTVAAIGSNLPATLILYYVEYVLESQAADLFLLLYFSVGIACLPLWVKLAAKIGKKAAWMFSMVVNTGAFAGVFFLGAGDAPIYGVLVAVSGMGFGATLALPSAIQADTIDYDELLSGQRREGRYVGIWSISKKLAAAVGVGVALFVLGRAGYVPNAEQSEAVKNTLRVFYALVPVLCNLAAMGIVYAYPIGREAHAAIREAVRLRRAGSAVRDPLQPNRILQPAASEG